LASFAFWTEIQESQAKEGLLFCNGTLQGGTSLMKSGRSKQGITDDNPRTLILEWVRPPSEE